MGTNYFSRLFLLTVLSFSLCPGCKESNKKLTLTFMETMTKGQIRGWGHAVVIQTPEGHTYLFDTGQNYPDTDFDCGKDMIAPFLKKKNIKEIDGVVISHAHNDHFGGFQYLMNNFKIKHLWDSGYPFPSGNPEYDSIYKPEYIAKGGLYGRIIKGDKLNWGKSLKVEILSPPNDYLVEHDTNFTDGITHHNPNLNSIVLRLKYKNNTFLFVGDLISTGQEYLIKQFSAEELKTTVLCLAHGDSYYLPFVEVIKPEIVIESCLNGVDNPARKAKEVFSRVGSEVYATCWNGTVQVVSDGNICTVTTERNSNK